MPDLVFELGTEEMPAGTIEAAQEQLRESVRKGLGDVRLDAASVVVHGTPRRLILLANGVPERQPDQTREVRGPARSVAFDAAGVPTGAALGFAKKQGVAVDALNIVSTPQGEYIQARVTDLGRPAGDVLGPILATAVKGLFFPKMMRWGDQSHGGMRFVRPIRWILALLDDAVVPLEISGVTSDRTTRGHRFLAPDPFNVPHASTLLTRLKAAFVMYDAEERRREIRAQSDRLAAEVDGTIPWDEGLLDENTYLVEWPTALRGNFADEYLELPRPVLVTAMKKHQRFFPVEDADGRSTRHFISIRSGGDAFLDVVREGNERVLTARFSDAKYFYAQDQKTPLEVMAGELGRLIFQEKLGTMAQKRLRLEGLAGALSDSLGWDAGKRNAAFRAAAFAKADLVSRVVVELPSLQGIMGQEYALAAGEAAEVAQAVAEHYRPRSANDALPETSLGKILAVADRIDTLVGYAGIGILPSGSSDPYGLRRAAQGVVQILAREPEMPPVVEIQVQAAQLYGQVNDLDFPLDPLCNELAGLFRQRLAAYLDEQGVRYDLVNAALSDGAIYHTTIYGLVRRAEALQQLAADPNFVLTVQAAARTANILRAADREAAGSFVPGKEAIHGRVARGVGRAVSLLESEARVVEQTLLTEPSEQTLFETAYNLLPEVARRAATYDYAELYRVLDRLRAPIDTFFDEVMVMVDNSAIRRNRLALLTFVDTLYKTLADFTRVVLA